MPDADEIMAEVLLLFGVPGTMNYWMQVWEFIYDRYSEEYPELKQQGRKYPPASSEGMNFLIRLHKEMMAVDNINAVVHDKVHRWVRDGY